MYRTCIFCKKREAEEIAAIADNLLLPEHTNDFLDRHSRRTTSAGPSPRS